MNAEGQLTIDWIADALPQQLVEEMPENASLEKAKDYDRWGIWNHIIIAAVFDDDDVDDA